MRVLICILSFIGFFLFPISNSFALQSLGMVSLKSVHGRYLQAHTNGEMHASNTGRNEEETWFLIEVDKANHVYALQNWRTGFFLSKDGNCGVANRTILGPWEKWTMVSGKSYGIENAVAFKGWDGGYLWTNAPGDDDNDCGGEVHAHQPSYPQGGSWSGWWVMNGVEKPKPGRDVWNTVGNWFSGYLTKITPADVIAFLGSIL